MSTTNGRPCHGSSKRRAADAEAQRINRLAASYGLPEPATDYRVSGKLTADCVWPEHDLAMVALSGNLKRDLARINACALDGWLVAVVTPGEWQSGAAFALAARVAGLTATQPDH